MFLVLHHDLDVFHLGDDGHGGERRVAPLRGVEGRDPDSRCTPISLLR